MDTRNTPDVVLHVPHASANLDTPPGPGFGFLAGPEAVREELIRSTDWYTDDLFRLSDPRVIACVFPHSRLLVDVERFPDAAQEPMAALGRGVFYTVDGRGRPLRTPVEGEARRALLAWYEQHHVDLLRLVDEALAVRGTCLIIDAHSFPAIASPLELDPYGPRPDICIGTDAFHTPKFLAACAGRIFAAAGFSIAFNRPYAGALVPLVHYGRTQAVNSVMVELNRRLYLDEATALPFTGYPALRTRLQDCLNQLIEHWHTRTTRSARTE